MAALSRVSAAPGVVPIDAVTIRRIAESAPTSLATLANVPGISSGILSRYGMTLIRAVDRSRAVSPLASPDANTPLDSGYRLLESWRDQVAREQGVPSWQIAPDALLLRIWECRPTTRKALAAISGVGPKFMIKYSEGLLTTLQTCQPPD